MTQQKDVLKKWYKSRTIIANLVAAVMGMLPMIDLNFLSAIGCADPAKYYAIIGVATTFLNVVLRRQTTKPISTQKRIEDLY